MTPLSWIIISQTGHRAPAPAQVLEVLMGSGAGCGTKIKGHACKGVILVIPLDPLVPQLQQVKNGMLKVPEG